MVYILAAVLGVWIGSIINNASDAAFRAKHARKDRQ